MSNDEWTEGKCNASPTQDGGYCALTAGYDTDHLGEGKCKYHGGRGGAPNGNTNGEKHGIYTQRSTYYQNLSGEEKAWVDALVESMLGDAPFTKDNFQKFQMLREIGIDMHKKRQGNDYTAEEGLVQENVVRDDEGDPIMRDGELVTETEENPVNLAYDRLDRTMTSKMKKLGLLSSPEDKKAEAQQSVSEQLSKLREEMTGGGE